MLILRLQASYRAQRVGPVGLGLNKMHRVSELEDFPDISGMIRKVQHMVEVVEV